MNVLGFRVTNQQNMGLGCGIVVEHSPGDREVKGSILPARRAIVLLLLISIPI